MFERQLKQEYPYSQNSLANGDQIVSEALYDLESDIGEQTNVIDRYPDVADRLRALADKMRVDIGDSIKDVKGRNRRPAGKYDGDATWPPDTGKS